MIFAITKDGGKMAKRKKNIIITSLCILSLVLMCGCGKTGGTSNGSNLGGIQKETQTTTTEEKRYNATDIAIVISVDTSNMEISLRSVESGRNYSLTYTGGTKIRSRNSVELTMSQVSIGEIVDVYYVLGNQKLIEMQESKESWENNSVVRWDVDYDKQKITIGSTSYKYDENLYITSNGKEIGIRDVSGVDELIVKGVGSKVCSVVVDKGHGYIRLVDETNMVDGIIEIGGKILTVITKGMVIAAPEGTYNLTATKDGSGGTKQVTVTRDEEVVVSLSEFQKEATRYGSVKFIIGPDDAKALLYVNGKKTAYDKLIELPYGRHKIVLESNQYDTYEKIIIISSVYTTINIDMSGEDETKETTTVEETTKENSTTEETTKENSTKEEETTTKK